MSIHVIGRNACHETVSAISDGNKRTWGSARTANFILKSRAGDELLLTFISFSSLLVEYRNK